jgi:hypothetical protein
VVALHLTSLKLIRCVLELLLYTSLWMLLDPSASGDFGSPNYGMFLC